mmetsp:Transcript_76/g.256  ORF Transcript_76/g.256 Transcript_76/m.256 type:complete len:202 (-) Transcript_76:658-1263(-)
MRSRARRAVRAAARRTESDSASAIRTTSCPRVRCPSPTHSSSSSIRSRRRARTLIQARAVAAIGTRAPLAQSVCTTGTRRRSCRRSWLRRSPSPPRALSLFRRSSRTPSRLSSSRGGSLSKRCGPRCEKSRASARPDSSGLWHFCSTGRTLLQSRPSRRRMGKPPSSTAPSSTTSHRPAIRSARGGRRCCTCSRCCCSWCE